MDLSDLATAVPVASVLCGLRYCVLLLIHQSLGPSENPLYDQPNLPDGSVALTRKTSSEVIALSPRSSNQFSEDLESQLPYVEYSSTEPLAAADETDSDSSSLVLALILWLALSAHALIAGLTLGADTDDSQWGVLIAILAHKGLGAFSLCCSLRKAGAEGKRLIAPLTAFVCTTPVGVVVGMVVSSVLDGSDTFTGILKALAAGTFLFVPTMELIPEELHSGWGKKWFKLLSLFLGYACMSILTLWV